MCGRLCGCSVWMGVSGEWMCGRLCGCNGNAKPHVRAEQYCDQKRMKII